MEVDKEEENQILQWVMPLHLDDEFKNLDLWVTTHAQELGVDVEWVSFEKVHSESFNKDSGFILGGIKFPIFD